MANNIRHEHAHTRVLIARSTRGQTHDDCQWLDEEDGEKNVLRNGWCRNRCGGSPAVAQHESWDSGWEHNAGAQYRTRDRDDKRRIRLTGVLVFRRGATAVCLCLSDGVLSRVRRAALVHRAVGVGTAVHARFRRGSPARAHGSVAADQHQAEGDRRELMDEPYHIPRMLDGWCRVKSPRPPIVPPTRPLAVSWSTALVVRNNSKLSLKLSLRRPKTALPEPTPANSRVGRCAEKRRICEEKRRWPKC